MRKILIIGAVLAALPAIAQTAKTPFTAVEQLSPEKTVLLLVITSDRGLCGAFNTNILRAANRMSRQSVLMPSPCRPYFTRTSEQSSGLPSSRGARGRKKPGARRT